MKFRLSFVGAAMLQVLFPAHSAELVSAEPESVDLLERCQIYPKGFFAIPGTQTCIRFSGYVRSVYAKTQLRFGDSSGFSIYETTAFDSDNSPSTDDDFSAIGAGGYAFWGQRGRLNIDTRNETEWGILRAQYRLEGGSSNVDADIDMDRALISIAGFRFGFSDNYWSTNHDYSVVDIAGFTGASIFGVSLEGDGWFGFDDATLADYTWGSDDLAITIGVEDPRNSSGRGGFRNATNSGGGASEVNFYAGLNWSGAWGFAAFTAVHDSLAPDNGNTIGARCTGCPIAAGAAATGQDIGGWAYKINLALEFDNLVSGGILNAMYMWDGEYNTDYLQTFNTTNDPMEIWQVAAGFELTDTLDFAAQYTRVIGDDANVLIAENQSAWIAGIGLNWFPLDRLKIAASYSWGEVSGQQGSLAASSLNNNTWGHTSYEFDQFAVVIRRNF